MSEQIYTTSWRGIDLEITYVPSTYGNAISHVQVKSINPERQALPITSTGYRSHFLPIGTVEANGGDVVQQVLDWIDEEAAKPEWTARAAADRQGDLFD